jgi:hypothetical protein
MTAELRPDPSVSLRTSRDAIGKTAEERFAEIRRHFLGMLREAGISRSELYDRPKPGASREPTEEELVRRYAERFAVSVNEICIGIQRAFVLARESGGPGVVTSFRYCVPQIERRIAELREARVGAGPQFAAGSKVNWSKVKSKP